MAQVVPEGEVAIICLVSSLENMRIHLKDFSMSTITVLPLER
jgi:hypothetical protein